jgi:zinc protease
MTYLVGSRQEGSGERGMAHLLEHMVFKGSTKHTNIPQELTSHGARPNGTTSYDRTNYFETFQATDDNLKWALDLEADRMVNSFIKKADLDSEFTVVRNEFEASENNPIGVLCNAPVRLVRVAPMGAPSSATAPTSRTCPSTNCRRSTRSSTSRTMRC